MHVQPQKFAWQGPTFFCHLSAHSVTSGWDFWGWASKISRSSADFLPFGNPGVYTGADLGHWDQDAKDIQGFKAQPKTGSSINHLFAQRGSGRIAQSRRAKFKLCSKSYFPLNFLFVYVRQECRTIFSSKCTLFILPDPL